jgi:chemotaxis protein CheD
MAIGERNAEFAKEWLAREGIALVASDFLGPWSRKVLFVPRTGEAYCKRIPITQVVAQVAQAEQAYEKTLTAPKPEKKIELF